MYTSYLFSFAPFFLLFFFSLSFNKILAPFNIFVVSIFSDIILVAVFLVFFFLATFFSPSSCILNFVSVRIRLFLGLSTFFSSTNSSGISVGFNKLGFDSDSSSLSSSISRSTKRLRYLKKWFSY